MNKKKIITLILIVIIFLALTLIGAGVYSNFSSGVSTDEPKSDKEYKLDQKHEKDGISITDFKMTETDITGVENMGESKGYKITFTITNDSKEKVEYGQVSLKFLYEDDADGTIERTFNFNNLKSGESTKIEKDIILEKNNFYDYELSVIKSDDAFNTAY